VELAMRGFAISFLTPARILLPLFFPIFFCTKQLHHAETATTWAHFARLQRRVLEDFLHDIKNQANNHQRPNQSVSEHRCLLVFG
jgi:hypothetical protein